MQIILNVYISSNNLFYAKYTELIILTQCHVIQTCLWYKYAKQNKRK